MSERARKLDDGVSDAGSLSNDVVAIFDELDDVKASIPILGSIQSTEIFCYMNTRTRFLGQEAVRRIVTSKYPPTTVTRYEMLARDIHKEPTRSNLIPSSGV